jgi:hypothetical protein
MTVVRCLEATGDAGVGLTRHRELHDRMIPVLSFTTTDGRQFQIKLTVADLRGIGHDIVQLFSASADEVASWWGHLADGADGRPTAPRAQAPSDGVRASPTTHTTAGTAT